MSDLSTNFFVISKSSFSFMNLFQSTVVKYSDLMSNISASKSFFVTNLLTLSTLFSVAVKAVVITKLVMLGILPLTSFILALRAAVLAKLLMLSISSLAFILTLRVVLVAKFVMSGIYLQYF